MTRLTAVPLLVVALAACDTITTPDDQPLPLAPDQPVFVVLPAEPEYFYYLSVGGETLRRVDVTAATPTPEDVGPTGTFGGSAGLATSRAPVKTALGTYPAGTLFGLLRGHLYVFNTKTGSAVPVVSTLTLPALAFGADGATLFAADPNSGLLVINPVSGTAALGASFSGVQPHSSLEFDPATGRSTG